MITRGFSDYMRNAIAAGRLVVQPRMGFSRLDVMRDGLQSVRDALQTGPRIGTVTIDAYTRVGQIDLATRAIRDGRDLNGFPIISHGTDATVAMLDGLRDDTFPVQIRHGTALPLPVFTAAAHAGFDSIEGGPISYNFPYSRQRLAETTPAWAEATRFWADYGKRASLETHIETFAGCMFGQLCPPCMLVALSILEGLFFVENGIHNISLSLAQGIHDDQDIGALLALSRLSRKYLSSSTWHVVLYTFMGQFPRSERGAQAAIETSARIAVAGGAHRLIVKTAAEAHGIPTIAQNLEAMHWARSAADGCIEAAGDEALQWAEIIAREAEILIEATFELGMDWSARLQAAFASGVLDIPYCIHPDNRNETRATIDPVSRALVWARTGQTPLSGRTSSTRLMPVNSQRFQDVLDSNRSRFDDEFREPEPETRTEVRKANGRLAIVVTTPDDSHLWNLIGVQLKLEERGFEVRNLGPCTPAEMTAEAVRDLRPDLLVISTINGHGAMSIARLLQTLEEYQVKRTTTIVAGGQLTTTPATAAQAANELCALGCAKVFVGPDVWLDFDRTILGPKRFLDQRDRCL